MLLSNFTSNSKVIRKNVHIGYLSYSSTFQHPRTFYSSSHRYFGAPKHTSMSPAFTSLTTVVDSSTLSSTLSHSNMPNYSQCPLYSSETPISSTILSNRIVINNLNSLVDNIQNHQ